jgi:hypothetical protein
MDRLKRVLSRSKKSDKSLGGIEMTAGPLDGVRVVEITMFQQGLWLE